MCKSELVFILLYIFVLAYSIFYPVPAGLKLTLPLTTIIPVFIMLVWHQIKSEKNKEFNKTLNFAMGAIYILFAISIIGLLKNLSFDLALVVPAIYVVALILI